MDLYSAGLKPPLVIDNGTGYAPLDILCVCERNGLPVWFGSEDRALAQPCVPVFVDTPKWGTPATTRRVT
jgi:hypothetical protein